MSHPPKSTFFALILPILLLGISSCGTPPEQPIANSPSPSIAPSSTLGSSGDTPSPLPEATNPPSTPGSPLATPSSTNSAPVAMVSVTIYKADSQCETLVSEQVQVPGDRAMEAAVGSVIDAQSNADFALTGYRVSRSDAGVATVDLRLAPGSQRTFSSLSTCEQFALFGSLRETLTKNPQWQVKSVHFTEREQEIVF